MSSSEPPSRPLPRAGSSTTESSTPSGAEGVLVSASKNPLERLRGGSGADEKSTDTVFVYRHARSAVIWALLFNVLIAVIKLFVATFVTRSTALFSEGLHSLGDSVNSVTLLVGITRGNRAPDRTHPFGYGLETNFWALFASFILFVSALYAIWSGVDRIFHPVAFENVLPAVLILVVSLILEFFAVLTASRAVLEEVGVEGNGLASIPLAYKNIRQVVGPTTRFVFYEDTLAFLGALVALLAISFSEFSVSFGLLPTEFAHWPDAIGSVIIGGLLLVLAINLFRYNRTFLTGAAAPANVESRIQSLVLSLHGVSEVCDLKTIDQGLSGLIVHLKVEVDPDTQVKDVDDLTDRIKHRLQARIPSVREVFIEVLADESEINWSEKFYQLVEQGKEQGVLKPREEMILKNVYDFTESVVRDVMVPRMDVEYVDVEIPLSELADLIIETGHSRIPVYREHVDNIVGVVRARDVFDKIRKNEMNLPVAEIMREIDIYPENKPVSDLLEDFKRKKIQMAAVADEHGGFAGVVTIEDLMEEIVGEIWDEKDETMPALELVNPTQLKVSGKHEVEDLNEQFDLNIPTDEFMTIGGFVFGLLGREPEAGDQVSFEDLVLIVNETEGPRILTVTIESPIPFSSKETPNTVLDGVVLEASVDEKPEGAAGEAH